LAVGQHLHAPALPASTPATGVRSTVACPYGCPRRSQRGSTKERHPSPAQASPLTETGSTYKSPSCGGGANALASTPAASDQHLEQCTSWGGPTQLCHPGHHHRRLLNGGYQWVTNRLPHYHLTARKALPAAASPHWGPRGRQRGSTLSSK